MGDVGTYHFGDNLSRAVRHIARQLIDLIPKYYDTRRIARIIGLDGETDHVTIDPEMQQPYAERKDPETGAVIEKIYNPGLGKYDVCATTGPSYMTKRQEAVEDMAQLLQGNPELWQVVGDLFVKNMDWPGAQEIADRLKKMIDPKLLDDGGDDPELASAKQQMEAQQQLIEQMGQMLQNVQNSYEERDAARDDFKAEIEQYRAESDRMKDMIAVAAAITPEQVQQIVFQTLEQALSQPPLEMEESQGMDMGEMHEMQGAPQGMPPDMQMQPGFDPGMPQEMGPM